MRAEKVTHLPDRGAVSVRGPDAEKLLAGLITNALEFSAETTAVHAALLSPQGKILFEFFVVNLPGGYLLEVARDRTTDLIKRLTMYKLRADVTLADVSDDFKLLALWGPNRCSSGETIGTVSFADPRHQDLGSRILAEARFAVDIASATNGMRVTPEDYHAHRIALGIPEGGKDFAFGETFPHEACMDQLNGISFTKGCYVGQEIVARMEHRGTARKRVVRVYGHEPLTSGVDVEHRGVRLGSIGSVHQQGALALVRLDRFVHAMAYDDPITAGGVSLGIEKEDLQRYLRSLKVPPDLTAET